MDATTLRLHGRLRSTQARWGRGVDLAARHLAEAPASYLSWSGGKDSTAAALLVEKAGGSLPLVYCSHGVDFPEVLGYCADLASDRGWDYRLAVVQDADSYAARVATEHGAEGDNSSYAEDVATVAPEAVDGWIYGLRRDESEARRRLLCRHRGQWQRSDGKWTTAPCWDWSTLDVLAWLAHNNVDPCPIYARLTALGVPVEHQRVGFVIGGGGAGTGRFEWLRQGWPLLWGKVATRWPDVMPR